MLLPLGILASSGGAADYELISTTVLASTTTSVSFSSLPVTFKNLELRYLAKTTTGDYAEPIRMRFNSDTGANYSYHYLIKTDSRGVISEAGTSQTSAFAGWIAQNTNSSSFAAGIISLIDPFSANKNKTIRSLSGFMNTTADVKHMIAETSTAWYSTSAVTSITLLPETGGASFSIGSRFSLYGLKG